MSSHNDPVKPTPFDAAEPAPAAAVAPPSDAPLAAAATPRWVLPALAMLLLLVVAVVVWLPASLEQDGPDTAVLTDKPIDPGKAAGSSSVVATPAVDETPTPDASPWSDAQAARLRREAQESAAALLDLQFELREIGLERWAPEAFANVARLAESGDARYRERNYEPANTHYLEGLNILQALQAGIPDTLANLLREAGNAIEAGDTATADDALTVARLIEPDNAEAAALQTRLDALPRLLTLLDEAAAMESRNELAAAEDVLRQAAELDPAHQRTASELARVAAAATNRAFNAAMSEGYAALDEGRFEPARSAFRRAAALQSGSTEAASALQEVEAAETAGRLSAMDSQGRRYEQNGQWQQAVTVYERAQKVDSSVLFARDGLQRSRPRAQLDRELRTVLDKPERLSDAAVAQSTMRLLERARAVSPRGAVLAEQITQLEALLVESNRQHKVTLRSDGETEVTVYKVARLGRFVERELTLRPGTYTAVGTRDGYRDVRRQFTIAGDGTPAPVNITCVESI